MSNLKPGEWAEYKSSYEPWTNEERTVLVFMWRDGRVEVALRESSDHVWGPPTEVKPERQ